MYTAYFGPPINLTYLNDHSLAMTAWDKLDISIPSQHGLLNHHAYVE